MICCGRCGYAATPEDLHGLKLELQRVQDKGLVNRRLCPLTARLRHEAEPANGYTLVGIIHESKVSRRGGSLRSGITRYNRETGVRLEGKWLGFLASQFPDQTEANSWEWVAMDGMLVVWLADLRGEKELPDLDGLLVSSRLGPREGSKGRGDSKWPRYKMDLGTVHWWCQYICMGIALMGLGRVQSKAAGGEALIGRMLHLRTGGKQYDTFMMDL